MGWWSAQTSWTKSSIRGMYFFKYTTLLKVTGYHNFKIEYVQQKYEPDVNHLHLTLRYESYAPHPRPPNV